jgi:hypothetical protein
MIMLTLTAPLVGFGLVLVMEKIEDRMLTATPRVQDAPRPTRVRRRRHGRWVPDCRLVGAMAVGASSALTLIVLLMV